MVALRRSARAKVSTSTRAAPAAISAAAAELTVAPDVMTSSTRRSLLPETCSGRGTTKTPRTLARRWATEARPACELVCLRLLERSLHGQPRALRNHFGKQLSLVEAADKLPPPVQRHRHNRVYVRLGRQGPGHHLPQRLGKRPHSPVLEQVDEIPQRPFVLTKAEGRPERRAASLAEPAQAVLVQSPLIEERGPALRAVDFGHQRNRLSDAFFADRIGVESRQRLLADGTILGKAEREEMGPGAAKPARWGDREFLVEETREVTPPVQEYNSRDRHV